MDLFGSILSINYWREKVFISVVVKSFGIFKDKFWVVLVLFSNLVLIKIWFEDYLSIVFFIVVVEVFFYEWGFICIDWVLEVVIWEVFLNVWKGVY